MLRQIYQSARPSVRRRLAENPATPEELIVLLAHDSDPEVRASLAGNCSVPLEILEFLCVDENADVRLAMAEDPNTPPYLLHNLCDDTNPYVRDRAEATLEAVSFESQLRNEGFVPQSGSTARLGELLMAAEIVTEAEIEKNLRHSREFEMPLGRALVKNHEVDANVVIRALKLQTLVRKGKITFESAVEKLGRAVKQRQCTTKTG